MSILSILVACGCGKRFQAQAHMAGRRAKCPACGQVLVIPGVKPPHPAEGSYAVKPSFNRAPAPSYGSQDNANLVRVVSFVGGGAVVLAILLMVIVALLPDGRGGEVAAVPRDEVTEVPVPPVRAVAKRPERAVVSDDNAIERTRPAGPNRPETPARPDESGSASPTASPLATSLRRWHTHDSGLLRGSVPPEELEYDNVREHYSWMCQLLPHLGRYELYERFEFDRTWRKPPNARLAMTTIPEFLNPLDDRRRWKGYPYQGLALTHFAGMSGVEGERNVLAAELPRSDDRAGIFGYHEVVRADQITDGLDNTIMIIGSGEMIQAPWVQGGGATIRGAREPYFDKVSGFGSKGLSPRGAMVMFADGSARTLSANMDPAAFRAMCTIRGGETVDVEKWSAPLDRIGGEPTGNEHSEDEAELRKIFAQERFDP